MATRAQPFIGLPSAVAPNRFLRKLSLLRLLRRGAPLAARTRKMSALASMGGDTMYASPPTARPLMPLFSPRRPVEEWDDPPPAQKPDLFVPILVGTSFGGYALIVLYDVFFGNGLCGVTINCNASPW